MASKPSDNIKDIAYLVSQVGVPAVMCIFLGYMLWHDLRELRADLDWKLDRSIRNTRAIMQKLNIPVILDGDRASSK